MAALRAVGRALAGAGEEVGALQDAAAALGMGPGDPGSNDPRAVAELFRRVRGDPALRRICELAGRYRRVAQSRQRRKTSHGVDEVVGVGTRRRQSAGLLPVELARLTSPNSNSTRCAASPSGRRSAASTGLSSRLARGRWSSRWTSRGRWPATRSTPPRRSRSHSRGSPGVSGGGAPWSPTAATPASGSLALPPGKWDEAKLLDWLAGFIGGGSEVDVPVRELPRMYRELGAPAGVTDLVFVTDAKCRLPADVQKHFLGWKASAKARLVTLVIDSVAGDLALISDEVHLVRSLSPESDAVGRVLSL